MAEYLYATPITDFNSADLYNLGRGMPAPPWAGGDLNYNMGANGAGNVGGLPQLQAISGYQPWASNLPSTAGFGTKLGSWLSGNGQMIGNVADLAASGLQAYLGLQRLGMAKDALKFEQKSFKTNLRNSVQSYNTQMKDRITGRYYATEEERQAALKEAELQQGMVGKGG